jgi:anti-anti-sigma factor
MSLCRCFVGVFFIQYRGERGRGGSWRTLELTSTETGQAIVLAPAGRIDHQSASTFEASITPWLERGTEQKKPVIFDLSAVDYISSVGLRVFMLAMKRTAPEGGRMVLAGLQASVREVFEISRLHLVFQLVDSPQKALEALP